MASDENEASVSYLNIFTTTPLADTNKVDLSINLEKQAQQKARFRYEGECENAVAQLPPGVVDYLLGLFNRVAPCFLPSPLWWPKRKRDEAALKSPGIVSRSLRIAAAARLALATDEDLQEPPLKMKVDRVYETAKLYIDSTAQVDDLEDVESSLLLAELEFGRGQTNAARIRLQSLVSTLSGGDAINKAYLFDHDEKLLQTRPLLQTAILMLYWYFREMPPSIFTTGKLESRLFTSDSDVSMEESFASAQIRLACVHAQLDDYVESQPGRDDRTWAVCDQALTSCFNTLQGDLMVKEAQNHDSSVTFFVFGQQYLCTRIELQSKFCAGFKRIQAVDEGSDFAKFMSISQANSSDAVRLASGLRSFGQRYRFREAPLSFIRQIRIAAGVVVRMIQADPTGDGDSALINVLTFFCDVLRYMGEVHEQARILLDTLEQGVNSVLSGPPSRGSGSDVGWNGFPVSSRSGTPSKGLGIVQNFSRDGSRDSSRLRVSTKETRPQSSAGILSKSTSRPKFSRSTSTPNEVPSRKARSRRDDSLSNILLSPDFVPKNQSPQMDPPIEWQKQLETLKL